MQKVSSCLFLLLLIAPLCFADKPVENGNTDPVYRQLRDITVGSEAAGVANFVLKRDAATFTFSQGTFVFLPPVNGKVTGAVFIGQGTFTISPPLAVENNLLSQLTKSNQAGMNETFNKVVLRFTDTTYEEIKKAGTSAQGPVGGAADALRDSQDNSRKKIKSNFDARILRDVLSTAPGSLFLAFIDGQKYSGKMLFCIDPNGAKDVDPEEVSLMTYAELKYGIWTAFHLSDEYSKGIATGTQDNASFRIESQVLDTKIERNAFVRGSALATVVSKTKDLRAIGFNLFPTLRVQKVTDAEGNALQFIQEDKDRDADYWVILPRGLSEGEKFQIRTVYEGKEAVENTGSGNYYPVARDNWYPNQRFGLYSSYEMKFSVPKKLQVIGTGSKISETVEGDWAVTVWKSDFPLAVAGFNLGDFKKMEVKLEKSDYIIESYANKEPPDIVKEIKSITEGGAITGGDHITGFAMGSMDTTLMMKKPLAEAQLSMGLFDSYFGPIPFKRIAMSQQTACTYGQAWPSLVYMPICSFFDSTVRHQLGFSEDRGYWKTVGSHEVSHQWWGQTVGFNSYRDQWMSEGFAMFSASLFVQLIQKNPAEFRKYWKDQLDTMTERNQYGKRPYEVGPVTAGYRLSNSRSGFDIYGRLIYPKGGFILHMIRMMMWDNKTGDETFRKMMQEFVKTYYNKAASTEDFKAIVEKFMTPNMNLGGNGKLDWFFDQYVYGTQMPNYKFEYAIGNGENGVFNLNLKLIQSNVDDNFRMTVPVYLELAEGRMYRLGSIPIQGNFTFQQMVPLAGLKEPPKKAYIGYYYDILGTGY